MKLYILLATLLSAVLLAACSQDDNDTPAEEQPGVEVLFDVDIEGSSVIVPFTKSGDYDQGSIPFYIDSLIITAELATGIDPGSSSVGEVTEKFKIEEIDDGIDEPISMMVKAGLNVFNAETRVKDAWFWTVLFGNNTIDKETGDTPAARAEKYANHPFLTEWYPYCTNYGTSNTSTTRIEFNESLNQPVQLTMEPLNGRAHIVFETSLTGRYIGARGFTVVPTLYAEDGTEIISETLDMPMGEVNVDKVNIFSFNHEQQVEGTYIKVDIYIDVGSVGGSVLLDDAVTIPTVPGTVTTYVIEMTSPNSSSSASSTKSTEDYYIKYGSFTN